MRRDEAGWGVGWGRRRIGVISVVGGGVGGWEEGKGGGGLGNDKGPLSLVVSGCVLRHLLTKIILEVSSDLACYLFLALFPPFAFFLRPSFLFAFPLPVFFFFLPFPHLPPTFHSRLYSFPLLPRSVLHLSLSLLPLPNSTSFLPLLFSSPPER